MSAKTESKATPVPAPAPAPMVLDLREFNLPFVKAEKVTLKSPSTLALIAPVVSLVEESKSRVPEARSARQQLMDQLNEPGFRDPTKRSKLEGDFTLISGELDRWPERVSACVRAVRRVATLGLTQGTLSEEQWRFYTDWASRQDQMLSVMVAPIQVEAQVTQTAKETTITYGPNGKVIGAVSRPIA